MRLPARVVLATGNAGKVAEIRALLAGFDVEVVPQSEFGVEPAAETGATFVANALLKARHALAATGLAALADDSGLAVDALGGRPGVRSARYAGPDADDEANIDRLLAELDGIDARGAAFHCAICLVLPDTDEPVIATGEWRGTILRARRGSGGFGYDPVFFDPALGKSAAELGPAEKNAVSHRARALDRLARQLRSG